jgi:hypothetical protein
MWDDGGFGAALDYDSGCRWECSMLLGRQDPCLDAVGCVAHHGPVAGTAVNGAKHCCIHLVVARDPNELHCFSAVVLR